MCSHQSIIWSTQFGRETLVLIMALGIGGHAMPTYKFQVGQTVFIVPSLFRGSPTGRYLVTKKLPERDGELEYCVRSADRAGVIRSGSLVARGKLLPRVQQVKLQSARPWSAYKRPS
jgi:hypothetical protein